MADVQMVHHLHAATRIVLHAKTRIVAILIDAARKDEIRMAPVVRTAHPLHVEILIVVEPRKVADQTVRRREAILTVARLANGTAVAIADRADLRTWITDADLRRAVTRIADQVAATQKVVRQRAATRLAKVEALRHAAARAAETLGRRCKAVDHRSRIADPVQADLRGLSVVSHLAADRRSVKADLADLKWDHHG